MKIKGMSGEFGFKAALKGTTPETGIYKGWWITDRVFFSKEEIDILYTPEFWEVKWPVEVYEDGSVYVPSQEELNEENDA